MTSTASAETPPGSTTDHRDGFVPFPAELAERYRAAGYWAGRPLGELLRDAARQWPERPALLGDTSTTYAELDRAADRMAHGLLGLGIRPGDRVVVQLPNVPEFIEILFGLLRAGIIPVLTLPAHRRAEIEHLARLSGAVAYIAAERLGDFDYRTLAAEVSAPSLVHILILGDAGPFTALNSIPVDGDSLPDIDPSDIALMLVSGGTTGLPKLIARTHDDYVYNARASAEVCELGPDDVYLATLPVAHNFPLACPGVLGSIATGAAMAFVTDPSPENSFAAIERHRVTVTAVVPPLAQLWCAAVEWEEADLSSLRLLQVGGAKLAEVNARAVAPALGVRLQQVFGMAEGLLNYTRAEDADDLVCTTQGRPLSPADEVRVVDEHGDDVPDGAEGELLTRGPYTLRGYYRAPEHNSRAFTPDGFYRSGDLVRRLPSGHLVVSGRIKDVINRGGENISCDELEEHLLAYPGVRHAAAVGLPDPALGEKVCVVLVTTGELPALPDVKAFLTARGLATYKQPDVLRQADSLPVTAVGKIDKKALAAAL
ncbi:(2,3-dihydroxybenzoyl)adenylate synthase [Nocardia seriolae]|uniref:2-hydroxy-7-methoxy-5-methyl-1-naphthoate--CoA ligase n=3 Tax=Nocardia seriolae TaxID=37332 RepID=A0ABC8B5R0_9NOCA|nr:(2,3-dihydroxybenzoyl)adenylate synthase [Nocardia seriolae]APB01834.1 2-hydroxy-7-methoxy-5-methyl-1-naphthoate--CoA ligase [Nocardia seriolae]MTJ60712.1 AMP-binding protein [Nocardia seriolae]MTJ70349.1 AMP-binding protein [Nocardia seriolae]MTJ91143.1 AMP-binding protein [Nocardia seriolae]MTK35105.1 AMP-binding protein [Nocardia seriolae]